MQKTAYELRISVWSSDVCSSDLEGRGFVGRVVLLEGLFPRPPRRGLGILGRAVLEEVGVLDAVEDGVQPGQRVLGGAVDRLQAELGEARSEEHTSELQSLMRISYAVFCLKKKMNRTRQYTNTNTT